jgi:hypothetical protein
MQSDMTWLIETGNDRAALQIDAAGGIVRPLHRVLIVTARDDLALRDGKRRHERTLVVLSRNLAVLDHQVRRAAVLNGCDHRYSPWSCSGASRAPSVAPRVTHGRECVRREVINPDLKTSLSSDTSVCTSKIVGDRRVLHDLAVEPCLDPQTTAARRQLVRRHKIRPKCPCAGSACSGKSICSARAPQQPMLRAITTSTP